MQVVDSDGHLHEPFDLFERHMEKEFYSMRPRIVDLRDEPRDTGRWLVEGRLVPRLPFTRGVGGGGFRYQTPRHPQMKAKDNSLDDIEGRLQDMDEMEIDFQIVYPTALVWVSIWKTRNWPRPFAGPTTITSPSSAQKLARE